MLSKLLILRSIRALRHPPTTTSLLLRNTTTSRSFHSSPKSLDTATTSAASAPLSSTSKPIGAFRGGIFGFLAGAVCAGAGTFYYVMEEYRVSNELLTEDIYALQASVQKIHTYVATLEDKVDSMEKKKGGK